MLNYLGIYEKEIQSAVDVCEFLCDKYHLDKQELFRREPKNRVSGNWSNITDTLILSHYLTISEMLKEVKPDIDIEYEVNGSCSSLSVDGELI